jgi:hypothetical protein
MYEGLPGVCDALSAVWLADVIKPGDGTMGIDDSNFEQIQMLKNIFTTIISILGGSANSNILTFAFIDWFKEEGLGSEWFETLSEENWSDRRDDFIDYAKPYIRNPSDDRVIEKDNVEGEYDDLTVNSLTTLGDDLLDSFFDKKAPFNGIISINAFFDEKKGQPLNHEIAFQYNSDEQTFSIFDQNGGLRSSDVKNKKQIAKSIAEYMHRNYIKNPMRTRDEITSSANVELWFKPVGK